MSLLFQELFFAFKVSRFSFAMITYNMSDLFRENTNNCKNGEEAYNETMRAYGAMGIRLI